MNDPHRRWAKCGVGTLLPFTPATMGCQLGARELGDPPVRAFIKATMMATVLLNDMFSAAKEQSAKPSDYTDLLWFMRSPRRDEGSEVHAPTGTGSAAGPAHGRRAQPRAGCVAAAGSSAAVAAIHRAGVIFTHMS
ncbi:terpene synthase family protein [Nocardia sp. NBC_01730]|uniref:terpene synthase family protein n=1 Tax=Nocardia sp. NBC_01730 TaxID=2975998 RepID=UPI003FA3C4A4